MLAYAKFKKWFFFSVGKNWCRSKRNQSQSCLCNAITSFWMLFTSETIIIVMRKWDFYMSNHHYNKNTWFVARSTIARHKILISMSTKKNHDYMASFQSACIWRCHFFANGKIHRATQFQAWYFHFRIRSDLF